MFNSAVMGGGTMHAEGRAAPSSADEQGQGGASSTVAGDRRRALAMTTESMSLKRLASFLYVGTSCGRTRSH